MNTDTRRPMGTFSALIIAGIAAEIAFEIYGLVITPLLLGFPMEPANLVMGLLTNLAGTEVPYGIAYGIHLLIGAIGFPVGYWLLRKTILAKVPWYVAGIVWGAILWFVAQGILAPMMGRAFMMDWAPYTWSSLFAHPMMGFIIAAIYNRLVESRTS